jgi:AmmeMemoRadiSam system protein A
MPIAARPSHRSHANAYAAHANAYPAHAAQADAYAVQADAHVHRTHAPMSVHPLVKLAVDAIQVFVGNRQILNPPESLLLALPETRRPAAAFVCLKLAGELRGCIGTTHPAQENLALEVIHNAIAAASRDHRFSPVQPWEADRLEVTVDILGPFEPVGLQEHLHARSLTEALDPRCFGILVRAGERHGVLLPDIEGVVTAADQMAIAREKAGIGPDEPIELFRFGVTRYK